MRINSSVVRWLLPAQAGRGFSGPRGALGTNLQARAASSLRDKGSRQTIGSRSLPTDSPAPISRAGASRRESRLTRMRVVIHTQYFAPESGAPQARLLQLAKGLKQAGHEIRVLTAMPNYPTGRVFPGYGGIRRRERIQGIDVVRSFIYASRRFSINTRLASYFSFVISSLVVGLFSLGRADFVITESPPLFLGIAGYLLSTALRARWVFNVSDLWPESAVELGIVRRGGLGHRLAVSLEGFCYRKAWLVSGQSSTIVEAIKARFAPSRTYHLSNGVDPSVFCPADASDASPVHGGRVTAVYAGLHGLAQGLDQVIQAAVLLKDLDCLDFVLIGDGPSKPQLVALSLAEQVKNVSFRDPLPPSSIPSVIAAADICIVPLAAHLTGAVPSKLYEAMACAKPVVLVAEGEAADIVRRTGTGIVVSPGDIEGLANAIRHLSTHAEERMVMGRLGRQAALTTFNRPRIVDDFIGYLARDSQVPMMATK